MLSANSDQMPDQGPWGLELQMHMYRTPVCRHGTEEMASSVVCSVFKSVRVSSGATARQLRVPPAAPATLLGFCTWLGAPWTPGWLVSGLSTHSLAGDFLLFVAVMCMWRLGSGQVAH